MLHAQSNQRATIETMGQTQIATLALLNTYMANSDELLMLRNALILLKHGLLTFDILPLQQAV